MLEQLQSSQQVRRLPQKVQGRAGQSSGRHGRQQHHACCFMAKLQVPLDDKTAHRMSHQNRWFRQGGNDLPDITHVIVNAAGGQPRMAVTLAVPLQTQGMYCPARCGQLRHPVDIPHPGRRIRTVHEQQWRRLGRPDRLTRQTLKGNTGSHQGRSGIWVVSLTSSITTYVWVSRT